MNVKAHTIQLLKNTGFIFALALILGVSFGQGAQLVKPLVTPLLALIMTTSLLGISLRTFAEFRKLPIFIVISVLLNYIVLGGTFIGLSHVLVQDYDLLVGFVLIAAVPPAVAVIPFTYRLKGNIDVSLVGALAAYLAALVFTPIISIVFTGVNVIQPYQVILTVGELIIAPIVLALVLRRMGLAHRVEKFRSYIVNWGFFIVVYIIVGLNRDIFLTDFNTLLMLSIVSFIATFGLTFVIDYVSRKFNIDKPTRISLILLGTRKNYGLAGALALTFFGAKAALPTGVAIAFAIMNFIFLTFWVKRME
ncbi:bile acid:sodium symporter family protein [Chloroflexota bacterium]